jgi:hypothetical protein
MAADLRRRSVWVHDTEGITRLLQKLVLVLVPQLPLLLLTANGFFIAAPPSGGNSGVPRRSVSGHARRTVVGGFRKGTKRALTAGLLITGYAISSDAVQIIVAADDRTGDSSPLAGALGQPVAA